MEDIDTCTYHVLISGRVQKIGFRSWIKHHAIQLFITGWVKNREDGAVEATLQGGVASIRTLIDLMHQGPPLASIAVVSEEQILDSPKYERFIVIQ